jgi:hypothetical protein
MIRKITILTLIISIAAFFVYVNDFAFSHSDGSQGAGYSTSTGDGSKGCNYCHGSTPTSKTWLTSNVPTSGYIGGTNYTLTFSPTSSMGYEITSEKSGGTKVGTFASGSGYTRYNTNRSIVSNSNSSSKTFTWTAPAAGTGAVTFYGCFAPSNSTNYKSSLTINEACTAPTLTVSPSNPAICNGSTATLTASGTSTSYVWSSGGSTAAITVHPTTTTSYTVTGTLSGCTATSSVSVTVNAIPATPSITQAGFTLTSSASTGNQWYEQSTGLISGATNQSYTATVNGIYYTIVTVNGCPSAQSNKITVIITGINDITSNGNISYYPNPANDMLHIVITDAQDIKLSIFTIQGQLLVGPLVAQQKITSINISALEKGIYLIKAEGIKGTFINRFIKE